MRAKIAIAALLIFNTSAHALTCNMSLGFSRPDDNGATSVRVWTDPGRSTLFGGSLHVNTDGARRSYRVDDFWGDRVAMNNLCNAMSDKCSELTTEPQLRGRRLAAEKAKAGGWQPADLAATKIDSSIIPFRDGKPCPEQDGYLVSATGLVNPKVSDLCSPDRYADSMAVPAIVLPRRNPDGKPTEFERNGAQVGDLVVVATPDLARITYAVVGDTGPRKELGEGTIALAKALLGKTKDPDNYREIRGKTPYQGKGWDVPRTITLVLSNTRNNSAPYVTRDRIDEAAAAAFKTWGGLDRLRACAAQYRS